MARHRHASTYSHSGTTALLMKALLLMTSSSAVDLERALKKRDHSLVEGRVALVGVYGDILYAGDGTARVLL